MSTLLYPERYESITDKTFSTVKKAPISFDINGKPLCFVSDDAWAFQYYVLGEARTSHVNVSQIPIFFREVIYTTYLAADADHRQSKVSSIINKLHQATTISKKHPNPNPRLWFNKESMYTFLKVIKGEYAYSSMEHFICSYLQMINSDNSAGEGQHICLNKTKVAKKYCRKNSTEKKQTLAMPISISSQIMANALSLVESANDSIDELSAVVREVKLNRNLFGTPEYIMPSVIAKKHLAKTKWAEHLDGNYRSQYVGMWLNRTITAAHNLLMAFTGVRIHEVHRIHDDSFKTYEDNGFTYHTITAETSKLTEGEDLVDTWVCAEMCGRIMTLIKHLKEAAGVESKSIMLTFPLLYKGAIKQNMSHYLRLTENLVDGVVLSEECYKEYCQLNRGRELDVGVGDTWPLANHQWRRTFATMSLRFDLATLPALKRQFKHVSLQMTEWYTNYARITRNEDTRVDSELNKLIHNVQVEMSTDVLYDAYNSSNNIAGGKGIEIRHEREHNNIPEVYKDRSAIKNMLEQGQISLKFAGLNYCTNGYRCDQDGIVNAAFCVDCKSSIIDEKIAIKWKSLHERCVGHLEFAFDCGDVSPVSYAHFTSQIRAAEHVMDQFDMQYEKFQELS
jgi:integrase